MHLGAGLDAVDEVFGGEVDVPPAEEDGLVVEGQRGEGGEVVLGVVDGVGRAEAPVGEGAGGGAVGGPAGERRGVGMCQAGGGLDVDGGLRDAGVAEFVFWGRRVRLRTWGGNLRGCDEVCEDGNV